MPSKKSSPSRAEHAAQPALLALPPVPKARKRRSDAKPVRKKRVAQIQAEFAWDAAGLIAGVDEAGRGPLAGNVVAAAVILDADQSIKGLADSKQLTAQRREKLYAEIQAKALCVSVGQASVEEIDRLNILQATMLAMQRAVNGLRLKPGKVLVDGNRIPKLDILAEAIVGGDAKVTAISAASIIAKVTRDRQCQELHAEFPHYGFDAHKGYGTAQHLAALQQHGATAAHRKSYAPVAKAIAAQAAKNAQKDGA
jgi:ribonuclease HII